MLQYLIRRVLLLIPMTLVMSIVTFAIILAPPGDYLTSYIAQVAASGDALDESEVESLRMMYGLDQPVHMQYLRWLGRMLHGDLGMSLEFDRPVTELIGERLGLTLLLAGFTMIFNWSLAIPIGIISAVKQYSFVDHFATFFAYVGLGMPNFLLALVIMWYAYSKFGLKVTGLFSEEFVDAPWSWARVMDMIKHMWIPMLVLGLSGTAHLARIVRANLLDELRKPYVTTARAKGLKEHRLLIRYPVRIALGPFVSTAGWALPGLFSGSLIVATVLNLPTIGPVLLRALMSQDMFLAGSIVLIMTVLTMVGTVISDIILAIMDPRIRMGE